MSSLKKFSVKFFGAKRKREQITLQKFEVEASERAKVEDVLRTKYGFIVINGLKIR